jgi:hypothetical protein
MDDAKGYRVNAEKLQKAVAGGVGCRDKNNRHREKTAVDRATDECSQIYWQRRVNEVAVANIFCIVIGILSVIRQVGNVIFL